jgi:DNA-binding HxlR family transcriptional regulator
MKDERRSKYRDRPRSHCTADMQDAVSVIEGRWKMMILAHLFGDTVMRFSDLQWAIPKVSQKASLAPSGTAQNPWPVASSHLSY